MSEGMSAPAASPRPLRDWAVLAVLLLVGFAILATSEARRTDGGAGSLVASQR